jgi:sugar/nucleoside kinase (ribokinase family)
MIGQTLVIGSTVVDVLVGVPQLPRRGQDVNISSLGYRLGGCAYNVFKTLRLFKSPALLCSPVGQGPYGRMIRERFAAQNITPFINLEKDNGCCYCLIEKDGERTFLSWHGAEYLFSRSWMKNIDYSQVDSIFICGLELEESTGAEIADFVCQTPQPKVYFSPGPRIMHIDHKLMKKIFTRNPILHLNETEARAYAKILKAPKKGKSPAVSGRKKKAGGDSAIEEAAAILANHTGNAVVITLGSRGCYYRNPNADCSKEDAEPSADFVSGYTVDVRDTLGAGDAHCGAFIASLKQGKSLKEACVAANKMAAKFVQKGIKAASK